MHITVIKNMEEASRCLVKNKANVNIKDDVSKLNQELAMQYDITQDMRSNF